MEDDGLKTNDKPWLFKKGNAGGPGRPKGSGKSLKEYSREYLSSMTEEERLEFLDGLPKVDIWKMAEGMPDTKTDLTSKGEKIAFQVVNYGDNTNTSQVSAEKLPDSSAESTG